MKRYILLLLLTTIFSCQDNFNPKEFKGTWIPVNDMGEYTNLGSLTFKNDSVYLEDAFTYNLKGCYERGNKSIAIFLKNDTINYNLNFSRIDSTLQIKNYDYMFLEGYSYENTFINYDLINLKVNQPISSDSLLNNYSSAFHLFKNSKNKIQLKLNDKISSDFSLIPRFAFRRHGKNDSIIIYIGKNITLNDIIKCYVELSKVNINKVFLLTHIDIKQNNYSGFLDYYEIWQSQIDKLSKEKIEPPLKRIDNNRKLYFQKYPSQTIIINKFNVDINLLEKIDKNKNYLIQIDSGLSLENYILLKKEISRLTALKNIKIRTEFINF